MITYLGQVWKGWGYCLGCNGEAPGGGDFCESYCALSYWDVRRPVPTEPQFRHGACPRCTFLGRYAQIDLWWCPSTVSEHLHSVMGRFGDEPHEYASSHPPSAFASPEGYLAIADRWYVVALLRAAERGLWNEDETMTYPSHRFRPMERRP